jgi:hypothetical protein
MQQCLATVEARLQATPLIKVILLENLDHDGEAAHIGGDAKMGDRFVAIHDSGLTKNEVHPSTIITAIIVVLIALVFSFFVGIVIMVPAWIIAYMIMNSEISRAVSGQHRFKKLFPFRNMGGEVSTFRHTFEYETDIAEELSLALSRKIESALGLSALEPIVVTDVDTDLSTAVNRNFLHTDGGMTRFGTDVHLIVKTSRIANYSLIQWWVVIGGFNDKDKQFRFVTYAPLTIWFWLIGYLKNDIDILKWIQRIHDGEFNLQDTIFRIRALHEVVFDVLVRELDARGIDTSSLQAQQSQVMNISISGGKVQMGNIIQGSMNTIAAAAAKVPASTPKA